MTIEQLEQAVVEAERQQQAAESLLADVKSTRRRLVTEEETLNAPSCPLPIPGRATRLMELASDITRSDIQLRLAQQAAEQASVRVTEARQQLTRARNGRVLIINQIRNVEEELERLQVRNVRGEHPHIKQNLIAEAEVKLADLRTKIATLATQPTQSQGHPAAV